MTREAIDQLFDRANHGDITAQALVGQLFLEGNIYRRIGRMLLGG